MLAPVQSTVLKVHGLSMSLQMNRKIMYKSCYLSQRSPGFREYPMMHLLHNINIKCNGSPSETISEEQAYNSVLQLKVGNCSVISYHCTSLFLVLTI